VQAVQGHIALLQQYLSTTPPNQPAQRHPSLPKCNIGSLTDNVSGTATGLLASGQSADSVSNSSASRDNRSESDDEVEYPSDTDVTVKSESDSRCVLS
jgi:hypothetical protein